MKILMMYTDSFQYETTEKSLLTAEDIQEQKSFTNTQLAFIQMEEHDETKPPIKKVANFIKWLSRKNEFTKIVLHSFSHLSESKANPEFTVQFFNDLQNRLETAGFEVFQTPFGYFLNLDIQAPGFSLARVFKSF